MADKEDRSSRLIAAFKDDNQTQIEGILSAVAQDFSQKTLDERYDILLAAHDKFFGGNPEKIDRDLGILAKSQDKETKYNLLATTLYEQLGIEPGVAEFAADTISNLFSEANKTIDEINKSLENFLKRRKKMEDAVKNSVRFDGSKTIQ